MENAIEVKNLIKTYWVFEKDYQLLSWLITQKGKPQVLRVLNNISFSVKPGEIVGLIGQNGAVKTTLMKIISGITFPTRGEVSTFGKVGSLIDLNAGFVPDYSGRQNIIYKATLMNIPNEEVNEIMDSIVEFADIGEYFDMPIRTYSQGMKSRLGFSLAVFFNPDILVVDEVLAVGDRDFRKKSLAKTKQLFQSGKSILFASHSEGMIRDFCTRAIYLSGGKIVYDGDVDEAISIYNLEEHRHVTRRSSLSKGASKPA